MISDSSRVFSDPRMRVREKELARLWQSEWIGPSSKMAVNAEGKPTVVLPIVMGVITAVGALWFFVTIVSSSNIVTLSVQVFAALVFTIVPAGCFSVFLGVRRLIWEKAHPRVVAGEIKPLLPPAPAFR